MKRLLIHMLRKAGYEVVQIKKGKKPPSDFEPFHLEIWAKVQPYTMTSAERIFGLIEAVRYIERAQINGAVVECGVWKGGSMLAVAETLNRGQRSSRDLYLYDTFEGMPPPGEKDVDFENRKAADMLAANTEKENNPVWAYSTLTEVKKTMSLSTYPASRVHYVQGKVEETIPKTLPDSIALLRLDTDWYESTRHELIHLFPRLQRGGVLIIDDYGFWKGARKAVDEYFDQNGIPMLLNRLDETGRIAIKQ